ncbi:MAG: winged helix-turn-helix domain-containing protein, partial [Actinomycetota bacterium]
MKICHLYAADPEEITGIVRDLDLLGLTAEPFSFADGPSDERADLVCVWAGSDAPQALQFAAILGKEETMSGVSLLALVRVEQLRELFLREGAFDDFLVVPYQLAELDARLRHLLWRAKQGEQSDILNLGPLVINFATYQVHVDAEPVDLTYMEYELLKFLATHRGRVLTRQTLLSR